MRFLLLVSVALAALLPVLAMGQDDATETPLGDVARNLRKKAPTRAVIDDDNLTEAMQQAERGKGFGSSLRFLMSGDGSGFRVAAPDVTCKLAFTASVKSLLSSQYAEMNLPPDDLSRLEGHATIGGDAFTISVHNGTDWHVSEIAVAVTVVNKNPAIEAPGNEGAPQQQSGDATSSGEDLRAEKKPDKAVIYRMRAVGVPWSVTMFSARTNNDLAGNVEWHWAIVEARGYPPESYRRSVSQSTAEIDNGPGDEPTPSPDNGTPHKRPLITPVSGSDQAGPQLVPSENPQ